MFKKESYFYIIFFLTFSIFLFTFVVFPGLTYAQDRESKQLKVLGDTLFQSMNIEELKNIQSEYQKRINRINDEEGKTRDRGLEVTEEFLEREGFPSEGNSPSCKEQPANGFQSVEPAN